MSGIGCRVQGAGCGVGPARRHLPVKWILNRETRQKCWKLELLPCFIFLSHDESLLACVFRITNLFRGSSSIMNDFYQKSSLELSLVTFGEIFLLAVENRTRYGPFSTNKRHKGPSGSFSFFELPTKDNGTDSAEQACFRSDRICKHL